MGAHTSHLGNAPCSACDCESEAFDRRVEAIAEGLASLIPMPIQREMSSKHWSCMDDAIMSAARKIALGEV